MVLICFANIVPGFAAILFVLDGHPHLLATASAFSELHVLYASVPFDKTVALQLSLPFPLQHALVIPSAKTERQSGSDKVGDDVCRVELALVGQSSLNKFGSDREDEHGSQDDFEGQTPRQVKRPVPGQLGRYQLCDG